MPKIVLAILIMVIVLCAYLPFASAGWYLLHSMWLMATGWAHNASVAGMLSRVLSPGAARIVTASLLSIGLWLSAWYGKDLLARLQLAMVCFIVFTTTLFPWYLIIMFPLLVLRPDPVLLIIAILISITDLCCP